MRSIKNLNKLKDFKENIHTNTYNFDIIALAETWLDETVIDSEIALPGYKFFRSDRDFLKTNKCCGGGLLLYVKDFYNCRILKEHNAGVECLSVSIETGNQIILFTLVYAPPFENKHRDSYLDDFGKFSVHMDEIIEMAPTANLIICGDFNLPGYTWTSTNETTLVQGFYPVWQVRHAASMIEELCNRTLCKQIIKTKNEAGNCLDLIFTDIFDIVYDLAMDPLVTISEKAHPHPLIATACLSKLKSLEYSEIIYDYNKMNIESITYKLASIDWNNTFTYNLSVDEMTDLFYNKLYSIIDSEVPKKVIKSSHSHPPWFDLSLKQAVALKKKLHCNYKESPSEYTYNEFKLQRARCKKLTHSKYTTYLDRIETEIKLNPKKFWNFVDLKNSKNRNIPDSVYLEDIKSNNGQDTVDLFADHFKQIYNSNSEQTFSNSKQSNDNDNGQGECFNFTPLHTIHISEIEIKLAIEKLNNKLGMGPDRIPVKFIKGFINQLVGPLYLIFEKSNQTGVFPSVWKKSYITPVPKKGDKQNIANYRSIIKNSIFGKLFDSLLEKHLSDYIRKIITDKQHGFMPKRSTVSNLAIYNNFVIKELKKRKQVDSIYTDMRAAFDRVDHDTLLKKLEGLGVVGNIRNGIKSFLKGRKLIVKIKNYESYEFTALSGVPQGSHCGPLLFLIMINDLVSVVKYSEVSLFADDFKIFRAIECRDDFFKLQSDLHNVCEWAETNKFEFNLSKCAVISFYKQQFNVFEYKMNNHVLSRVDNVKDLGVFFGCGLDFETHIQYIINKASRRLGFVKRYSRNFKDATVFLHLYKSLVKPILTYASEVWSPKTKQLKYEIEKIQNSFLRSYSYRIGMPMSAISHDYSIMLEKTKLPTLEASRDYQDLLFLYKIINSLVDSTELVGSIGWHVPSRLLRPTNIVFKNELSTDEFNNRHIISRTTKLANKKLSDIDFNNISLNEIKKLLRSRILFQN